MTSIRKFTEFVQDSQAQENGALNSADDRQGDCDGSDAHRCSSFDGIVGGNAKAIPQSGFPSSGETVTDESGVKGTGQNDDQFKEGKNMGNENKTEWRMVPVEPTPEMCRAANGLSTNRNRYAAMLSAAPMPPKSEHGPIQWTPGQNVFKDWCSQYFGPDSDDTYLAEAVFNLPPMAQKFKYSEPCWPDGTPKAFDNYEHDKRFAEESPSIPCDRNSTIEECAKWFDKKADEFAREYGSDDMGGLSFGRGDHAEAKREYHNWLLESAEELRALKSQPAPAPADDEVVAWKQFLSNVITAAGLLSHGKADKKLAERIGDFAFSAMCSSAHCARCAKLEKSISTDTETIIKLHEKVDAIEAENARLERRYIEGIGSFKRDLVEKLEQQRAKNARIAKKLAELEAENAGLRKQLAAANERADNENRAASSLYDALENARATIAQQAEALEAFQIELEAARDSLWNYAAKSAATRADEFLAKIAALPKPEKTDGEV